MNLLFDAIFENHKSSNCTRIIELQRCENMDNFPKI